MLSSATRIVGLYSGLAIAWVVGSDRVLEAAGLGEAVLVQNVKGVVFVLFTALVLLFFLRREFQRRARSEDALRSTLERLAQSEADLRSIIEKLPDAFFRTNLDGRISMASPQFAREFGLTPQTVIGTRIADHYVEEDGRAKFIAALEEAGGEVRDYRVLMRRQDGSTFWISANAYIRRDPAGRPIGVEGIARNTTVQHHMEERLRYLAGHDALTGLCNRIRFEDRLEQAIARAKRENRSFALLFLDLDGFKEVNDTHGHHRGDEVLVTIAQRLSGILRNSDTTARMGGDEFAVLLEGEISPGSARGVAEKIVAAIDHPLPGLDLSVSASVGVALYPGDGTDADMLLRVADQAMYRAKRLGKNRLELGTA
ncbi:diguanylate cyclase domain-containing protein [Roseomonas genomospecies 6]|uniref:Diguanylate cyclase n=1 Tax=Roseomonas genomospecies 6 TaxID=214106 RepID=A0A9W7U0B7_9PROT|nr:diguanylate cyclase [Roseomonas genomospecies 6]KAA0683983.1 diguanylate cyclase [Roseomonas genomospecies 6]